MTTRGVLSVGKVSSCVADYARAIVDGWREVFEETGLAGHAAGLQPLT